MSATPIRIGTRTSALAVRQARIVEGALTGRGIDAEIITFTTLGDKRVDAPLHEIGAKGLFTKELEVALRRGKIDCAVHSLKDLPTDGPEELALFAVLPRDDPRDVVVVSATSGAIGLADLPAGSRVGTSSLRRRAQLQALRRDLEVVDLRGNVPTRLRKVDQGQVHAAILAAAGLRRLGAVQHIAVYLEPPDWLPAAGQGAIAVQGRADDAATRSVIEVLHDPETMRAVSAERALLAALDGGCQVPIGALLMGAGADAVLHGFIADPHGRQVIRGARSVGASDPADCGRELARELRERGGGAILAALRAAGAERVPAPQPE
jgi:hydroxymethylbilane synthase